MGGALIEAEGEHGATPHRAGLYVAASILDSDLLPERRREPRSSRGSGRSRGISRCYRSTSTHHNPIAPNFLKLPPADADHRATRERGRIRPGSQETVPLVMGGVSVVPITEGEHMKRIHLTLVLAVFCVVAFASAEIAVLVGTMEINAGHAKSWTDVTGTNSPSSAELVWCPL